MLICREHKNCKEGLFECLHKLPHEEEDEDCRTMPCASEWAKSKNIEAYCEDIFISNMRDALEGVR